jgi:hypothetical protein
MGGPRTYRHWAVPAFSCALLAPRAALALDSGSPPADAAPVAPVDFGASAAQPAGPLLAGGLTLAPEGGSIGYRLDAGTVVSSGDRADLRLLLATSFDHSEEAGFEVAGLAPFLTIAYVRSVLERPNGRVAVLGEAGAGPIFAWVKTPDMPYMPAHWDSEIRPGARIAGAVEYRALRGWLVQLQPVGVLLALVDGDLDGTFEFGLRVGYEWP